MADDRESLFREFLELELMHNELLRSAKANMDKAQEVGKKLTDRRVKLADALGVGQVEN